MRWQKARSTGGGAPNARGGFDKFPLRDSATWPRTALEVHHVFARGVKKPPRVTKHRGVEIPYGQDAYESIVNRCLLLKSTNAAIGVSPFPKVYQLESIREAWMSTYLLDPRGADWTRFVKTRLDKIEDALRVRLSPV